MDIRITRRETKDIGTLTARRTSDDRIVATLKAGDIGGRAYTLKVDGTTVYLNEDEASLLEAALRHRDSIRDGVAITVRSVDSRHPMVVR